MILKLALTMLLTAGSISEAEFIPHAPHHPAASADSLEHANELVIEAQQARNAAEYERAEDLLGEVRPYVNTLEDWTLTYRFHTESGHLNRVLGRYSEARTHFNTLLDTYGDEHVREKAVTLNNIAVVYLNEDKLEDAIKYQRQSLEYRYQVSERREVGLAVTYFSLGRSLYQQRRPEEANRYFNRSLEYMEAFEHPALRFNVLNSLGDLQSHFGNLDGANLYYEEARELAETLGPREQAQILMDLGTNNFLLGDIEKTEELYALAMEHFRELNIPFSVPAYLRVVDLNLNRHNIEDARFWIDETLERLERFPGKLHRATLYEYQGLYHYLIYEHDTADRKFRKAIETYRSVPGYRLWPNVYWNKAFNMMEIDQDEGFRLAEEARYITEQHRMHIAVSGNIRAEAFQGISDFYARLARRYIEAGNAADAFRVMEQSKSRSFAEDLTLMPHLIGEILDEAEREQHQQIRSEMIRLENQTLRKDDSPERREMMRRIEDLGLRGESLLRDALSRQPDVNRFFSPEISTLDEARASLPPGTIGLHLSVSNDGLTGLMFSEDHVESWVKDLTPNEAAELTETLRTSISERRDREEINRLLASASERLFSKTALDMLERSEMLLVSTDGALAYLPMEALRPNDAFYLIERMPVVQTPSFTVRKLLAQRMENRPFSGRALAVTSPDYTENPDVAPAYVRSEAVFRPLPFSRLEGDWVSTYFPGETDVLTGPDAREFTIRTRELLGYDVLHFAAHGILDERNPRYSGIVLSLPEEPDELDDGFLRTSEIYTLELDAELVVLSACNTGIGRLISGEGVLGFQRAFMFAGSGSVAVTLWSIEDRSTAVLMRNFYRYLSEIRGEGDPHHTDYVQALRRARLDLLNQRGYSHPVHWASFVFTGI